MSTIALPAVGWAPAADPITIGVSVVNFHSVAMVRRLLESICRATGSARVVISCVDNSQSGREVAELAELQRDIEAGGVPFLLWQSPTNSGYAAGNNAAVERLSHHSVDVLVVVNPDVLLHRGDLGSLGNFIIGHPGAISTVRTWSGRTVYNGLSVLNRWTSSSRQAATGQPAGAVRRREVTYPGGHFIALSMSTWRQLGGLCEDYFLFAEEADLTVRARAALLPVLTTDLVEVIHDAGGTTGAGRQEKSLVVLRHATRSAVIFSRKHNVYRTWLVVLCRLALAVMITGKQGFRSGAEVLAGVRLGLLDAIHPVDRPGRS